MLDNLIFNNTDLIFDDLNENNVVKAEEPVHVSVQKRSGKKYITIIEGLADDLDLKKILKFLRNKLKTNGAIINGKTTDNETYVIQLQGDKRNEVAELFAKYHICLKESIILHGA